MYCNVNSMFAGDSRVVINKNLEDEKVLLSVCAVCECVPELRCYWGFDGET